MAKTKTLVTDGFADDESDTRGVEFDAMAAESEPVEVGPVIVDRFVSLDGMTPESVIRMLFERKELKLGGTSIPIDLSGHVWEITATLGAATDQVVVDDHAYSGERVGSAWHFSPGALEMACRVAGWSTVEWLSTEPAKLRLS